MAAKRLDAAGPGVYKEGSDGKRLCPSPCGILLGRLLGCLQVFEGQPAHHIRIGPLCGGVLAEPRRQRDEAAADAPKAKAKRAAKIRGSGCANPGRGGERQGATESEGEAGGVRL